MFSPTLCHVFQYVSEAVCLFNPSKAFDVSDWTVTRWFSQICDEQQIPHNGSVSFLINTFLLKGHPEVAFTFHKACIISYDTTIRTLNVSYDIWKEWIVWKEIRKGIITFTTQK